MCTRYYIERDNDLQSTIESVQSTPLALLIQKHLDKTVIRSGEVRPSDIATVIASNKNGVRSVFPMIWGFTMLPVPRSSISPSASANKESRNRKPRLIVNCRIETASSKPLWKDSWFQRRCIIPASYYYEWGPPVPSQNILRTLPPADDSSSVITDDNQKRKKRKIKYAIRPKASHSSKEMMYLAGLYRIENGYPHFAVLTREPGDRIRFIHDRMPVILKRDNIDAWINPQSRMESIESLAMTSLTDMDYETG